ncbi:GNAT family N-acetyltransferase [Paenibacillus sp. FSL R7-0337]|uniref:GNAT family N-acetyltransferase n=1 Tax=Paenibacillus sp. FSL R7-0337 TaxID=1926588 RepID=UPI00096CD583|nr:GNAT family N-acetyltransferase [Paenibacillus sp. FSL R7-0337]OMF98432.1 GNAT family N-acetyltransferase [Paenibacillus sp. FSL R7-0337]
MTHTHKIQYPTLETERLLIRELTLKDAPEVYRHFRDSEVTRFMDIEPCKDLKEAEEIIGFHVEDSGTRWGVIDRDAGDFMGTCGYHCWYMDEKRAELGFDLSPGYWGKGFMFEALEPVLRFAFTQMGLERIEATVEPANRRSLALLNRCSFIQEEELREGLIYLYLPKDRWEATAKDDQHDS